MPTRKIGLDVLRALAILLVILHHFRHLPGCPLWLRWAGLYSYVGVDLFFVLSGWLVGGQLVRELDRTRSVQLWTFWQRRWWRTLPAYLTMLLILLAIGAVPLHEALPLATFTGNYFHPHLWLDAWSLCVEEHFYFFAPLLGLAMLNLPRRLAIVLALFLLLLSPLWRALLWPQAHTLPYPDFLSALYVPTHLRLDGLALGTALAWLRQTRPHLWTRLLAHKHLLALVGTTLFTLTAWNPWLNGWSLAGEARQQWFAAVPSFTLLAVGAAMLLPWAETVQFSGPLAMLSTFVAELAYAIYLLNHHVREFLTAHVDVGKLGFRWSFVLCLAVTLGLAWLLREGVEKPGLRVRERVVGRKREG